MLPRLVYNYQKNDPYQIGFYGLNLTENHKDGELASCHNLSSMRFPYLSPRKPRSNLGAYTRPTAIYAWNGLAVVDGTDLYYNGKVVGNVTSGEKQFCVVNTKIVVWPDKKYLDLTTMQFKPLEGKITSTAGTVTFTEDTLSMSTVPPTIGTGTSDKAFSTETPEYIRVYTGLEWDENSGWVWTGEAEKRIDELVEGDCLIPYVGEGGAVQLITRTGEDYLLPENSVGVYIVVSEVNASGTTTEQQWEKFNVNTTYATYYTQSNFTLVDSGVAGRPFGYEGTAGYVFNSATGGFSGSGGAKNIYAGQTGTTYQTGTKKICHKITFTKTDATHSSYRIEDANAQGPFQMEEYSRGSTSYGYVYGDPDIYPQDGKQDDFWYVLIGDTGREGSVSVSYDVYDASAANGRLDDIFKVGDMIRISGCETFPENNYDGYLKITAVGEDYITIGSSTFTFTAGSESGTVTILRPIPDLDYICESENRLWGVSNKDNTIYASALGDPSNFFDYSGMDTDSFAVAVGSNDKWTGICAYSNSVLCWKERMVHKVMGAYPSQYTVYQYHINGLQDGSYKSLKIINEVLYYKGVTGIYQYTGATPTLISYELGNDVYRYAVSGADTERYYVSMQGEDGEWWVYVYDTIHGLWLREDNRRVLDFAYESSKILMLCDDSCIYQDGGGNETVNWSFELAPFNEGKIIKKGYTKLVLRIDMEPGSWLSVEVKEDRKPWKSAFSLVGTANVTKIVPIRLGRCDRFSVRISGFGDVTFMGMTREFSAWSDV